MRKKQHEKHFLRKPHKEPNWRRKKQQVDMNKNGRLTHIQGPSIVICMIVI
jgi:hypothetical protein